MQATTKQALAEAYTSMKPTLIAIFRQAGITLQDCEDMTQNTFLKVMNVDTLRLDTLPSLIVATAYRLRTDYLRHQAVVRQQTEHIRHATSAYSYDHADAHLITSDLQRVELSTVSRMASTNQRIYHLSRFDEKACDEIASVMNMSYRAVESRLYRARHEVRQAVAKVI